MKAFNRCRLGFSGDQLRALGTDTLREAVPKMTVDQLAQSQPAKARDKPYTLHSKLSHVFSIAFVSSSLGEDHRNATDTASLKPRC